MTGKTWEKALLKQENGRYAYTEFRFHHKPTKYRKINIYGKSSQYVRQRQPLAKDIGWNHGGYKYNGIDKVTVEVV